MRIGFAIDLQPGSWEWCVELVSDVYFVIGALLRRMSDTCIKACYLLRQLLSSTQCSCALRIIMDRIVTSIVQIFLSTSGLVLWMKME